MMNEQEMQFADPDWKPTGPLSTQQTSLLASPTMPVTVASAVDTQTYTEQAPAGLPAYDQGYQGAQSQPSPVSQFPTQPFASQFPTQPFAQRAAYAPAGTARGRGRMRWWVWVVIAIIALSMISPSFGSFRSRPAGYNAISQPQQVPQPAKQVYDLQGATQLNINDLSGNVTIQVEGGIGSQIGVRTDNGTQPQIVYQGSTMTLTSNDSGDITVSIPQNLALNLSGGTNDIEVDNFSGLLTAQTDSGQITLNNATLSSGSTLNTNSGTISLEQGSVSDTMITSSTGDLTLNGVFLSGKVTLSTGGNGSISYTGGGTLDPHGQYQFTTDSGTIDLALPQGTAMQLKVAQKSGSYHSDFPNSSGSAPQASVGVTTNSGDITISQQ